MNPLSEPSRDRYDVVVIGAGVAGLTAGGLLARSGQSVLVVDQRPEPGGVCHCFRRDGYTFDVGPHLLSGCGPSGTVRRLLEELGVAEEVEFLPVSPLAGVRFPGEEIEIPAGLEDYQDLLCARFPREAGHIRQLLREMQAIYEEVDSLPSSYGIWDFLKVPVTHPIFIKYPAKTFEEMVDVFLSDPALKARLGSLWVYFGLPPSRISAIFWSVVMMSYLLHGGAYPRGGIGALGGALATGLRRAGGELLCGTSVERIVVSRGRVAALELADVRHRWTEDGHLDPERADAPLGVRATVRAGVVISCGDARRTLLALVGREHLSSKYIRSLDQCEPSLSLLKVSLGIEGDVREWGLRHHDTVLYASEDMDAVFEAMRSSLPEGPCDITAPTITDPSLAPPGHHVLHLWNYAPYEAVADWRSEAPRAAEALLRGAEMHLPGLRARTVVQTVMSPWHLERYSLSFRGAPYGWAFLPGQMGFKRLQPRTPIKGLYLAGHWTTPGAGIAGVVLSGRNAAAIVQAREGLSLWRRSA